MWVDKPVRTPSDMRTLGFELKNAYQVLSNINAVHELNTQVIIFDIVTRLPVWVQQGWNKQELKSKKASGNSLKFSDLGNFVSEVSDEMSDPLVGVTASKERMQHYKGVISHSTTIAIFILWWDKHFGLYFPQWYSNTNETWQKSHIKRLLCIQQV